MHGVPFADNATGMLYNLDRLVVYVFAQRWVISGVTRGSVK